MKLRSFLIFLLTLIFVGLGLKLRQPQTGQQEEARTQRQNMASPARLSKASMSRSAKVLEMRTALAKTELSADRLVSRMKVFADLGKKVLKSDEEQALFLEILGDGKTQEQALHSLNPLTPEDQRMVNVDYINYALRMEKDRGRQQLLDQTFEFLESEIETHAVDRQTVRSLAADRIELLVNLQRLDAQRAAQFMDNTKNEINRRIAQYVRTNWRTL